MSGIREIVQNGGVTSDILGAGIEDAVSPRKQGLKQGGIMMLSSLIVLPILGILTEIFNLEGYLVGVAAITLFWGGLLRMIYALVFQPGTPTTREKAGFVESLKQNFLGPRAGQKGALPPAYHQAAHADFQPASMNWRETADLQGVPNDENATRPIRRK